MVNIKWPKKKNSKKLQKQFFLIFIFTRPVEICFAENLHGTQGYGVGGDFMPLNVQFVRQIVVRPFVVDEESTLEKSKEEAYTV